MTTNMTTKRMAQNMHDVLASRGYEVKFSFLKDGIQAKLAVTGAEMTLKYHGHMTPGEVTFAVAALLDKLNGKAV